MSYRSTCIILAIVITTFAISGCSDPSVGCDTGYRKQSIDIDVQLATSGGWEASRSLNRLVSYGDQLQDVNHDLLHTVGLKSQQWSILLRSLISRYNSCALDHEAFVTLDREVIPKYIATTTELDAARERLRLDHVVDSANIASLLIEVDSLLNQIASAAGQDVLFETLTELVSFSDGPEHLEPTEVSIAPVRQVLLSQRNSNNLPTRELARVMQAGTEAQRNSNAPEAIELATSALQLAEEELGPFHSGIAIAHHNLALALGGHNGDSEVANKTLPHFLRSYEINRMIHGDEHQWTANRAQDVAVAFMGTGNCSDAIPYFETSLSSYRNIYDDDHANIAVILSALANCNSILGQLDEAEQFARQGYEISAKTTGADSIQTGNLAFSLAQALLNTGNFEEAHQMSLLASNIRTDQLGFHHPLARQAQHFEMNTRMLNPDDSKCASGKIQTEAPPECAVRCADTVIVSSSEGLHMMGAMTFSQGQYNPKTGVRELAPSNDAAPAGPIVVFVFRDHTNDELERWRQLGVDAREGSVYQWVPGAAYRTMRQICNIDVSIESRAIGDLFGANNLPID